MVIRTLLTLVLLAAVTGAGATISARVEPEQPRLGESLRLVIEVTGSAEPDTAPLARDFELVGHSRTAQIAVVDGRMQRSTVHVYNLLPRRAGRVVVPALTVGGERTRPIPLTIGTDAATPPDDLRLEVTVSPRRPWVQGEMLLKVRILRRIDIANASLSEPTTDGDALIRLVGRDRAFTAQRDGVPWRGIERVYAVFPQASGPLTIAPFTLTTQVVSGAGSLFDPFSRHITTRRIESTATSVHVRPRPPGAPVPWLPARRLVLREAWSQAAPELRAGEPVTRTVAIIAEGLTAAQLPDLAVEAPPGVRVYPEPARTRDQEAEDGVLGVRQQRFVFIPTREGAFELPAIRVRWWDTQAGAVRTATLPPRRLSVLAADGSVTARAPPTGGATAPTAAETATAHRPPAVARTAAFALLVAAGLGATVWWWRRRPPRLAQLRRLARRGQWQALADALAAWARAQTPPIPTLTALAARCDADGRAALSALQARRFAPAGSTVEMDGTQLWQCLEPSLRALGRGARRRRQRPAALAPLYLHR